LKLFNNVGRSNTVGETSGRRNHSGLPQVTSFAGSARKRGIEGVSVRGCRLDSREMGSSLARLPLKPLLTMIVLTFSRLVRLMEPYEDLKEGRM